MKKIYIYFMLTLTLLLTSSCSTFGQVYYDDYDGGISYSVVVEHGVPYYVDNVISYYYYNGMYYYPYMFNNHWFVHPFDRPQPRGYVFRPNFKHRNYNNRGNFDNHHNGYFRNNNRVQQPQIRRDNGGNRGNSPRISSTRPQFNGIQMNRKNNNPSMRSGIPIGGNRGGVRR